ncbi:hypothetical protein R3W88_002751 [Solanum pinnatisectum]|uniref:Uncharacterized protein n=1 Tax=Solanum pinnatisectum TaxID=50273 RepID=A0AAV9MPY8_9SOLN|nr:hypothetical protein R3W88_002751 [Solanum pinnatisectum]
MEAACAGDIKLFKSKFPISRIENTIFLLYYGVSVDDCATELAKGLDRGKGLAATVASVKDGKERGALSFAATEGQYKMCKTHCYCPVPHRKGADPATPSTSGAASHNAAGNGHIELVKLLLSKGVDVDLQSDAGTPLMWAAGLGQEDTVKFDAQTGDDNMCPLGSAVAANSLPCVELHEIVPAMWFQTPISATSNCTEDQYLFILCDLVVSPEAKKKAADAKAKGDEAFERRILLRLEMLIPAYLLGLLNSSCLQKTWTRFGKGLLSGRCSSTSIAGMPPFLSWNQILPTYIPICSDILIFPSPRFEEAANAFYRGIQIDPNDELITALQDTVAERDAEAAKQFHDMELELSCVSYKS